MIRRLAVALALALVALAGAAPAHADSEIGFSTDGVTWSAALPDPLFPASMVWVPGDVESSSFFVRDQGPTDAQMTIDAFTDDTQQLLASGAMVVAARIGSGPWTTLEGGRTRVEPAVLDLARDATSKVTVRVSFRPTTTAQMDLATSFRLRVVLSKGDVQGINTGHGHGHGAGHVKGEGAGNGSGLPNTGSPVALRWIWLAAVLIGSGIALVVPRRRRAVDHG